jgi:selT/selW/selH-like putative selenoprotein
MILSKAPAAEVRLRKTRGGVFEITVDGRLRFSKKAAGRFPTGDEVLSAVV